MSRSLKETRILIHEDVCVVGSGAVHRVYTTTGTTSHAGEYVGTILPSSIDTVDRSQGDVNATTNAEPTTVLVQKEFPDRLRSRCNSRNPLGPIKSTVLGAHSRTRLGRGRSVDLLEAVEGRNRAACAQLERPTSHGRPCQLYRWPRNFAVWPEARAPSDRRNCLTRHAMCVSRAPASGGRGVAGV